ncbi:MAG: type II secretion system protein GspG [Bacteroidota bacterium]|nr:type II secretion system protein GspG [Bacteroidota bacterium]
MTTNLKSARHLYGRGWLGLIPLVGGIVGIGLIILGVFKYRDRKLIIIGAADLFFTVAIYSSMFYYFMYSDAAAKGFAQTSQMFLNGLVKELEFYKLKNGSYPDSLEQLPRNHDIFSIHDPLLSRRPGTKDTKYNYRKTGDTYILFSSGIDRIPNTKDDIYPTETLNNISKTDTTKH